jgi:hypothetical protein
MIHHTVTSRSTTTFPDRRHLLSHRLGERVVGIGLFAVATALLVAAACSGPASTECPNDYSATCPSGASTFAGEVAPLMHDRCTVCHAPGQQMPTMDTYADIRAAAPHILMQLTHCPALMPPAPITPLSPGDRRTILSSLACGAMDN